MRSLVCPARFERATYALEAVKMRLNNSRNNGLSLARSGVQYAQRSVESYGTDYVVCGIRRSGVGRTDTKSGDLTLSNGKPFLLYLSSPRASKFNWQVIRQNHHDLAWFLTKYGHGGVRLKLVGVEISDGVKNCAAIFLS